MPTKPHDKPSEVTADEGEVQIEGPSGIVVSLTPEAAAETSERLLNAACQARGQQLQVEDRARRYLR